MPRKPKHGDLSHLDLKKRAAPIGRDEKIHQRMERELTNQKRDRRFWEGDKVYRAYVQRQFDRVYNDPTGKPQPLRIGAPKIFATEIEPFGVEGARRKALRGSLKESITEPSTLHVEEASPIGPGRKEMPTSPPIRDPGKVMRKLRGPEGQLRSLGTITIAPPGLQPKPFGRTGAHGSDSDENEPGTIRKTLDFFEVLNAG